MNLHSKIRIRRIDTGSPSGGVLPLAHIQSVAGPLLLLAALVTMAPWTARAQEADGMAAVQLSVGEEGRRILLRGSDSGQIGFTRQAATAESAWYVTPVGRDMVRIQQRIQNQWFALGVNDLRIRNAGQLGPRVALMPLDPSAGLLWHVEALRGGGYVFENVAAPGHWLTCDPNVGLWLQPFVNNPWQVWWTQQPAFAVPVPEYRVLQEDFVPNPPLEPASLRVTNTHSETILVLLADRRQPDSPSRLRIAAGSEETVTLERDAGGTVVQTIEATDALGNWERQEYRIPVPPSILYDMSVYEEFLQSIAIDTTGTSPNVIEDINYQPRSVGFFLLPAGDGLPDSGAIDAYRAAADANNPGAVRRLKAQDLPGAKAQPRDPLREILDQIQRKRGKF